MSETFEEVDEAIAVHDARIRERLDRLGDWFIDTQAEMDERLCAIDTQNRHLAERVQMRGGFGDISIDMQQTHLRDQHDA